MGLADTVTGKSASRRGLRERVSAEEWQTRLNLAAFYRLVAYYGWTDMTATHISAAVPGEDEAFLINPYGLFFEEITASSLVKVDLEGKILLESEYEINQAGYVIHSAIHAAREDVACVAHTHTRAGMAVSAMACGLLSLNQHAMRFHNRLAYHDYEGIAEDLDERQRLVRDLGSHYAMILRNHGLLACGRSIAEAFSILAFLEKCCQAQVDALTTRQDLIVPPEEVCEHTARQFEGSVSFVDQDWAAQLRRLERIDPSYKN